MLAHAAEDRVGVLGDHRDREAAHVVGTGTRAAGASWNGSLTGRHRTMGRGPPGVARGPGGAASLRESQTPYTEAGSRMSSAVLLPIYIIIFVALIYFVGVRPQQKRRKEVEELSRSLRPGDEIVTTSGIYGVVSEIEDGGTLILQVAEDVDIRISAQSVARKATTDAEPAAAAERGMLKWAAVPPL